MKNNSSKNELSIALEDVRKAHRILYRYQNRILNLVGYIKDTYGMPEFSGNRLFCDVIKPKKSSYGELAVRPEMWAWDFIYSLVFEFYLGKDAERGDKTKEICMSVVEVSDDGFFNSSQDNKSATNINSFSTVETSESWLVFVFESRTIGSEHSYCWSSKDYLYNELIPFLSLSDELLPKKTNDKNYFILAKYKLQEFADQASTNKVLQKFNDVIFSKTGIKLLIRDL